MYHIPNDKRAQKSAEKLTMGLFKMMERKAFVDITVKDITEISEIGRATFYRLFDNIVDILYWNCEKILLDTLENAPNDEENNFHEFFVYFAEKWVKNEKLMCALIKASRTDILFDVHMKHINKWSNLLLSGDALKEQDLEYIARLLVAILPIAYQDAVKYPVNDIEYYYIRLKKNIRYFDKLLS